MDGINWNTWLQIFGLTVVNIGAWVFGASSGIPPRYLFGCRRRRRISSY